MSASGDGERPAVFGDSFPRDRPTGPVVMLVRFANRVRTRTETMEGVLYMSSSSFNLGTLLRSPEFQWQVAQRPAVLEGGVRVVTPPDDTQVVSWSRTRWGVKPKLSREPRRGEPLWPSWPQFSDRSLDAGIALLESHRDGGAKLPLGYLGPQEQALEQRYAEMIGPDAEGREPHVFILDTGTHGLDVAYLAILSQLRLEGRPIPKCPKGVTAGESFEATWTSQQRAGVQPVLTDVDRDTACANLRALEAATDDDTVMWVTPGLYHLLPEALPEIGAAAAQHRIKWVIDSAHAHMATWNGIHLAKLADIIMISGQASKIVTPGSELGILVTFDPVLAAFIAMIRNVGRGLEPRPAWWPKDISMAAGENARGAGEMHAILMGGSFDSYDELRDARRETLAGLHTGLAGFNGPWHMPPRQEEVDDMMYKALMFWDPDQSDKPEAWRAIGWDAARRLVAEEILVEVAAGYPPPWEPESEYHPDTRPWIWGHITPEINPAGFPNTAWVAAHAHCLPHELLARSAGIVQTLTALHKVHRWADHSEIQRWARAYRLAA